MLTSSVWTVPSLPLMIRELTQTGALQVNQPLSPSCMVLPGQLSKALVPSGADHAHRFTVFQDRGT